jgi:hypothetical protein
MLAIHSLVGLPIHRWDSGLARQIGNCISRTRCSEPKTMVLLTVLYISNNGVASPRDEFLMGVTSKSESNVAEKSNINSRRL